MALFEGFDELAKVAETGSVYGARSIDSVNGAGLGIFNPRMVVLTSWPPGAGFSGPQACDHRPFA